jgi:hypothetical protein
MKAIEAETCLDAWMQACEFLLAQNQDDWRAYNVILEVSNPLSLPPRDRAAFDFLNRFLTQRGGLPVSTVVNTIFPAQLYMTHGPAGIYERYMSDLYPEIRKHPDCSWGTYFQRIVCRTGLDGSSIYPLRDLVEKLKAQLQLPGPNRAVYELGILEPAFEIPIYDPHTDRTRPIGGPCLSHVSVHLTAERRVMLTGVYRSHFYVQRALGNLFGLAHLQHFIAEEAGLQMGPLVCHSTVAQLDVKPGKWGKEDVRRLIAACAAACRPVAA